ncbi:MAG: diphthine--ammonia ligase [Candidatus Aenigmarchaeota archaeon]|nr:diphthine--ammonia ligase [Candidatus Aenigmarchaeota archaeon]
MGKKFGVLFSGGKDSCLALHLAKKAGNEISCLISIVSENKESYMFHCPSILRVKKQAEVMDIPLLLVETKGEKEKELEDLERAIKDAKDIYKIEGVVTGAVESMYQSSRIQKICSKFKIECFNPLWHKDQFELLEELIKNKFEIILTGVFAYPLDKSWIEKKIDRNFVEEMKELNRKYKISPAGEGGEFETLVLDCPLFKKKLNVIGRKIFGEENSFRAEVELE